VPRTSAVATSLEATAGASARGFLAGDKLQTLTTFLRGGEKQGKYIYPFFFLQNYAVFRLSFAIIF